MSDGFKKLADTYVKRVKEKRTKDSLKDQSIDERDEYLYQDSAMKSIDSTFSNADLNPVKSKTTSRFAIQK